MKKLLSIFVAAMFVLSLTSGAALAQRLTIVNGTGFTIHQLGLVDSASNGDAQDLLGSDTLANGEGLAVDISGGANGWELIATDGENQVNWQNLNLTGVSKITIFADGTANLE